MTISTRGRQLQGSIARTFQLIDEHSKASPAEADLLFAQIIAHVRSARPHVLRDLEAKP
jgi:transposase InsO family protein